MVLNGRSSEGYLRVVECCARSGWHFFSTFAGATFVVIIDTGILIFSMTMTGIQLTVRSVSAFMDPFLSNEVIGNVVETYQGNSIFADGVEIYIPVALGFFALGYITRSPRLTFRTFIAFVFGRVVVHTCIAYSNRW